MTHSGTSMIRRALAVTTATTIWMAPLASALGAATFAATPAPAPGRPADAQTASAEDPGWPRTYTTPSGGRVQIYQPQIARWDAQAHLVAYAAVAYTAPGSPKPVLGTMKVEADTKVSLEARLVSFASFTITETNFGGAGREDTRRIVAEIEKAMPAGERVIALDRVLAGLDASRILAKNVEGLKADPPVVHTSSTPAVLVLFDGSPIWSPIPSTDLRYAVNTNWDVFEYGPTRTIFLRTGDSWLRAGAIAGPWEPAGPLPASFSRLPADDSWRAAKAALPGKRLSTQEMPTVFVSTSPAELVLMRGAPSYVLVPGAGGLLWVNNTESDVFRMGKTGTVYYLVAGRWFSAPDFRGPWTFATPTLPPELARIPVEHPRSRVLASVPGTPQALEAVLLAQVPQTARVHRTSLTAPQVTYHGAPQFEPIKGTTLARAVNTERDVIRVGTVYYLCEQGVWFVATGANGPWVIAATVPSAIYTIPASSPAHRVTYVTIVETDTEWVTFAASAGYTGTMVAWGCVVWGTGWSYPPYTWYGGPYPVYYPVYPTYGYAASYNPYVGVYERGAAAYGPYGGAGAAARYNPATGTFSRGAAAWGPYGGQAAGQAYNPYTGTYAQTRQGRGVYDSWGSTYVQRGDDWAQTARYSNRASGATTRVTRTDEGGMVSRYGPAGSGFVAAGEEGIYAGRDGNVYRRTDGTWQKYDNGGWSQAEPPRPAPEARERAAGGNPGQVDRSTLGQLERDRSARLEGAQRARGEGAARPGNLRGPAAPRSGGGPRAGRRR